MINKITGRRQKNFKMLMRKIKDDPQLKSASRKEAMRKAQNMCKYYVDRLFD
jgi:hypothetical protein